MAQAHLKDSGSSSHNCLTCLRDADKKYCYSRRTGAGKCCGIADIDTEGCSAETDKNILCSTDKVVARSSGYEVCPHNPEQCDTKTLDLNNNTWGEQTVDNADK